MTTPFQELLDNGQFDEDIFLWATQHEITTEGAPKARYDSIEHWERETGNSAKGTWGEYLRKTL